MQASSKKNVGGVDYPFSIPPACLNELVDPGSFAAWATGIATVNLTTGSFLKAESLELDGSFRLEQEIPVSIPP
jgi:hypothetical protein